MSKNRIAELEAVVIRFEEFEAVLKMKNDRLKKQADRIEELEAALREIDSVWNGPAGKNYPHNSDAGHAMYDISRRALGDKS